MPIQVLPGAEASQKGIRGDVGGLSMKWLPSEKVTGGRENTKSDSYFNQSDSYVNQSDSYHCCESCLYAYL